jgi:dipeptidyl aminopeptidase/acylaminoacyl peptidase
MPGGASAVAWPGDLGLIVSASGKAQSSDNDQLWTVPITGGEPVSLTSAIDENPAFVAATAKELLVEASARTGRALYRVPLAGGRPAGPPQRVSDDRLFYSGFTVAGAGGTAAFLAETSSQPPDVHVATLASFAPRRLTTVNPQASGFAYGEQKVISWRSRADSEQIEGILSLPVDYQPGTRVPLLVVIHGGPAGVSSNRFFAVRGAYPVAVFNALGYAVLQPNFRGSTGYGQRFRGLNRGDILGKDWIDVNSGVDAMIRTGVADSTKMGVMGWSYGGFQTFWGITQTTRFAAASAGAGANDLTSFWSQTDISNYMTTLLGAPPWDNFDLYAQHSAYRLVNKVTTPLLIQVGAADRRVPREQSVQFYEAVKGIGKVPVKLVEYPAQGHGISDPRLNRDLMLRNVQWFTYWMPVTGNKPPVRVVQH